MTPLGDNYPQVKAERNAYSECDCNPKQVIQKNDNDGVIIISFWIGFIVCALFVLFIKKLSGD